MNKIYGLNIDALRLCYEVTEPNNINVIKDKEIGEEIDFLYFYLRRIEGKHFKFVYEIRYNDMGKDKLFGELRLGINDNKEESNTHQNGYKKAWINISNRVLYSDEIYYLDFIESNLGLELHNITTLDLCLDMSNDIARLIRKLIRNPQITTLLNGKRITNRKEDRPEITYTFSGNMDKDKYLTVNIKQNKRFYRQKTVLHGHAVIGQFIQSTNPAGRKDLTIGIQQFLFAFLQRFGKYNIFNLPDNRIIVRIKVIIDLSRDTLNRRFGAFFLIPAVEHTAGYGAHNS